MDKVSASRLKNIIDICNSYKNAEYDIKEFQYRLEIALLPEPETGISRKIEPILHDADNGLEEAIYGPGNADEVADMLMDAINAILRNQYTEVPPDSV